MSKNWFKTVLLSATNLVLKQFLLIIKFTAVTARRQHILPRKVESAEAPV